MLLCTNQYQATESVHRQEAIIQQTIVSGRSTKKVHFQRRGIYLHTKKSPTNASPPPPPGVSRCTTLTPKDVGLGFEPRTRRAFSLIRGKLRTI